MLGGLKPGATVFAVTKKIYLAARSITVSDNTKIVLGDTVLGLYDPEKFRGQLLASISKAIAETKKSLGMKGAIEVEGLENPVSVIQVNEKDTAVFIRYRFKIQTRPM